MGAYQNTKNWVFTVFVFVCLAFASFAWYATADEDGSGKNFFLDMDQDGLSDSEEKAYGTDSQNPDTDGDGYSDGVEVESGFNPLKSAPGDKILPETSITAGAEAAGMEDENNLTMQASKQLATIVQDVAKQANPEEGVKVEDVDQSIQQIFAAADQEIILPEVDIKDIKVKEIPKKYKGKEREEKERSDVVQYLTIMGYLLLNNSPMPIQSQQAVPDIAQKLVDQSLVSLTTGNMINVDEFEKRGKKLLEEMQDVEVPEAMLDVHVKGLRLAKYASNLKSEVQEKGSDPLAQIATYGKVQALLVETQTLMDDILGKLSSFGIQDLPISL